MCVCRIRSCRRCVCFTLIGDFLLRFCLFLFIVKFVSDSFCRESFSYSAFGLRIILRLFLWSLVLEGSWISLGSDASRICTEATRRRRMCEQIRWLLLGTRYHFYLFFNGSKKTHERVFQLCRPSNPRQCRERGRPSGKCAPSARRRAESSWWITT